MGCYQVNFHDRLGLRACDWGWPTNTGRWTESEHESVQWIPNGGLTEMGRKALLKHFGLESVAAQFPLNILETISPAALLHVRRDMERKNTKLKRLEMLSDRVGDHCTPEQFAQAA